MACNAKIAIANKMKKLREEILTLTTEKEKYLDSPHVLAILEGFIRGKQDRITLLHFEYNMVD